RAVAAQVLEGVDDVRAELAAEGGALLGRLGRVEGVLVRARAVEDRVDRRSTHLVGLDPRAAVPVARPTPHADVRRELIVRDFQDDRVRVQWREEVARAAPEAVGPDALDRAEEAGEVEEERVRADPGEDTVAPASRPDTR